MKSEHLHLHLSTFAFIAFHGMYPVHCSFLEMFCNELRQ